MDQGQYNFWTIILQSLTVVAATVFAAWQTRINSRLKVLQDFVAISIIGFFVENEPKMQIRNVGRVNLYLHKWEIHQTGETYKKPRLLGCSSELFFMIPVPNMIGFEMPVKIYLSDEYGTRYVSTGAVLIQPRPMSIPLQNVQTVDSTQAQQQAVKQFIFQGNIFAWSYKTVKKKWLL